MVVMKNTSVMENVLVSLLIRIRPKKWYLVKEPLVSIFLIKMRSVLNVDAVKTLSVILNGNVLLRIWFNGIVKGGI